MVPEAQCCFQSEVGVPQHTQSPAPSKHSAFPRSLQCLQLCLGVPSPLPPLFQPCLLFLLPQLPQPLGQCGGRERLAWFLIQVSSPQSWRLQGRHGSCCSSTWHRPWRMAGLRKHFPSYSRGQGIGSEPGPGPDKWRKDLPNHWGSEGRAPAWKRSGEPVEAHRFFQGYGGLGEVLGSHMRVLNRDVVSSDFHKTVFFQRSTEKNG